MHGERERERGGGRNKNREKKIRSNGDFRMITKTAVHSFQSRLRKKGLFNIKTTKLTTNNTRDVGIFCFKSVVKSCLQHYIKFQSLSVRY